MISDSLLQDKQIKAMCSDLKFSKGQIILKQGSISDGLYVIHKGRCQLYSHIPGEKEPILLSVRGVGEFIGEISFIDQSKIVNTAKALTPMRVTLIPNRVLQGLTLLDPQKALELLEPIVNLTCNRIISCVDLFYHEKILLPYISSPEKLIRTPLRRILDIEKEPKLALINLQQLPIFDLNYQNCANELPQYFDFLRCKKNQLLYEQGADDLCIYFIISGALQTFIHFHHSFSRLSVTGPGSIIGLVDFFSKNKRTVSCMAREDAIVLRITWQEINVLKQKNQLLYLNLMIYLNQQITKPFTRFFMHFLQTKSISQLF